MKTFMKIILVFVCLVLMGLGFILYESLFAGNDFPEERNKIIYINKGMKYDDLVKKLVHFGVLKRRFFFDITVWLINADTTFLVGKYQLKSGLTNRELINIFNTGRAIIPIEVTIPEGLRIKMIARILQRELEIDSARYVNLTRDKLLLQHFQIDASSLEGYLFPSTYQFEWQMNEEEIITKQIETGKRLFQELQLEKKAKKFELTLHEILTLASIVEGETRIDSERAIIAGVYINRLRKNMPLQADPTIQYVIPNGPRRLKVSDYKFQSPFNTYLHFGLPPGPINNPGKSSILAVLNPRISKNIFFVANGTGGHTFSSNYNDHMSAVRKLRELLKEREREKRTFDSLENSAKK